MGFVSCASAPARRAVVSALLMTLAVCLGGAAVSGARAGHHRAHRALSTKRARDRRRAPSRGKGRPVRRRPGSHAQSSPVQAPANLQISSASQGAGSSGASYTLGASGPSTGSPAPSPPQPASPPTPAPGGPQPLAVLNDPFPADQQSSVPFGARSHWIQPWRGYLDTVPATTLLDAVGINVDNHVSSSEVPALAQLLHDSGFRRARYEIGWGDISYDDPTRLINDADVRRVLGAFRDNGIRPLILLNANAGQPCPVKPFTAQVTAPAHRGDTTLVVDDATASQVIPGRTGLDGLSGQYKAADVIFTGIAGNTVTLSKPLPADLHPGAFSAATLKYAPFGPPVLSDGSPNPEFEQTMRGWLDYVGTVTREAKAILGGDNFDVEVWNELTFGSDFLDQSTYYQPPKTPGTGDVTAEIMQRTVSYLRDPAHGAANVGVGDGFENERPGASGVTVPAGTTAIARHPYKNNRNFPTDAVNDNGGIRPVDALGNTDGTAPWVNGSGRWQEPFTPSYSAFFPEYFLTAIQTESAINDLSPNLTTEYGIPHGRYTHKPGAAAPGMWVTEWNMDPAGADLSNPANAQGSGGMSGADARHMQAKAILRFLVSWVNKGVSAIDFYAAKDGNLALVDQGFFSAVDANGGAYPGAASGGEAMDAMRRLTKSFDGAQAISAPTQLSLKSIGDFACHAQFAGDGTAAHPPLYDRNIVGFFPFQDTDRSWSIPVYVMTRNLGQTYRSGGDPGRFDLPDEPFELTIGGLPAGVPISATATDPLSGQSVPVTVRQRAGDQIVLDIPLTDSPRTLSLAAT